MTEEERIKLFIEIFNLNSLPITFYCRKYNL